MQKMKPRVKTIKMALKSGLWSSIPKMQTTEKAVV